MKDWYKKAGVLWTIISALFLGLVGMVALNLSYEPEMNRLRLENIKQDSTIVFQEIEILRLKGYKDKHTDEINNVYDLIHDYNRRIKTLEGN